MKKPAEKYEYDRTKVPTKKCIMCHELIGDRPWEEVTTLARFGQMLFAHTDCDDTIDS